MKTICAILVVVLTSSCWPTSVSFTDTGSMPPEWKFFHLTTLEIQAPNAPLSYAATLSESLKDGIQNNTRLLLSNTLDQAQVQIEGVIMNYSVSPIALVEGDNAAQNRLSISVRFTIFTTEPEEDEMTVTSTRFVDYTSSQDFATVETALLEEINTQIIQDLINKLLSNW